MSVIRRNNDIVIFRGHTLPKIVEPSCHRSMCLRAAQFLVGSLGCTIGMYEAGSTLVAEKPDAIGFQTDGTSILIECKTSRADFLADKKKPHRTEGGLGDKRYFFTPENLLSKEELPEGWGLIEIRKTSIKKIKQSDIFSGNKNLEQCILVAALAIEQKIVDKVVTEHLLEKHAKVSIPNVKEALFKAYDNQHIEPKCFNAFRSLLEFYEDIQP